MFIQPNFQLTPRDLSLIRWINSHGFVTIHHIVSYMMTTPAYAYYRAKCLVEHNYLRHNRIFHGAPGVYRVTLSGVRLAATGLPPLRHIPLATYQHDLTVVDLSVLLQQYLGGTFITERLLRQEAGISRFNHAHHVSDGLLKLQHKTIAIEIELSKKSLSRRAAIMQHYLAASDIDDVWYFCGSDTIRTGIQKASETMDFVHCFLLEEVLAKPTIIAAHVHAQQKR